MKVGDVLRITTAVFNVPGVIDVTAWLNPPKSSNCKAFYVADQKPFDKVMDAIKSHAVPVDTPDGPDGGGGGRTRAGAGRRRDL